MPTSYQSLRAAIELLASPAEAQIEWLDWFFSDLRGVPADYGNYELVETCYDLVLACDHMLDHGELTDIEASQVTRMHTFIDHIQEAADQDFWERKVLRVDKRWQAIRNFASEILAALPDRRSESELTEVDLGSKFTKAIPAKK